MSLFKKKEKDCILSEEPKVEVFDQIVSLGGTCQVACQLNRLGLRFASYPFDWLFSTDISKVIEALENNFDGWLLRENLVEDADTTTEHKRITDTRYHMIHQHIFPLDKPIDETYSEVKATVDRRVDRFLKLKDSSQRLLFIRTNLTIEESRQLGAVIAKKFGDNAVLLVINHIKEFALHKVVSGMKNVLIYEIYDENEDTGQNWHGYDPHWNLLLGRIRVRNEVVDFSDNSLFENFYGCETNEAKQKFRWSTDKSVLHLERFGGCHCHIKFTSPVNMKLRILDVYGNTLFEANNVQKNEYSLTISHQTRYLTLLSDTWTPSSVFGGADTRELGVCLESISIKRD